MAERTRQFDSTRHIDHASGWHDQGGGDFQSLHVYFKKVLFKNDGKRVTALTEFGGYTYKDMEHSFNPDHTYSYKIFPDRQAFNDGLKQLYEEEVIANIPKGLSACVYTQDSDVEDEVNGLMTYDRCVQKVDETLIKEIKGKVKI